MVGILFDELDVARNVRLFDIMKEDLYDVQRNSEYSESALYSISNGNPFYATFVAQKLIDEGANLIVYILKKPVTFGKLASPIQNIIQIEGFENLKLAHLTNPKVEKISARYHELQFAIGVAADCLVHDVQLLLLIVDSDVYADLATILRDKMDIILRTERECYGKDNDPSDIARSMAGAFDKVISNLDMITEVASHIRKES